MGWFGFGEPRARGSKARVRDLGRERDQYEDAVLIDRRGPVSDLPAYRPRRRDFDDPRR